MKKYMLPFINFSNSVLLLTNVWIVLYTSLISFLNFKFIPTVQKLYYRPEGIFPEPFEIPVYLLLILFFVVGITYLFDRFESLITYIKRWPFLFYFLFAVLSILFIQKIGGFPLSGVPEPFSKSAEQSASIIGWVIYLAVVIFLILEIIIMQKIFLLFPKRPVAFYVVIILIIALITFQAKFPITAINYAHFYGPAWEVTQGKTLFTEIPSRYGFLSILLFAFLHRIGLVDILSLSILIWFLYIVQYFLFFYLVHKTSRSPAFSLLGLFSLITIDYFSYIQSPQSGPLRWLPILLVIVLFYRFKNIHSKLFILILSLLSLWVIDSGVVIIIGYLLTLLFLFLNKTIKFKAGFTSGFLTLISIALLILFINGFHIILGIKPIHYLEMFRSLRTFAISGNSMIPIDFKTYFWIIVLIYFASILYMFRKLGEKSLKKSEDTRFELTYELIFLSANFMIIASTYYIGRSVPDYLFKLSLFPLLTFFLLGSLAVSKIESQPHRIIIFVFLFLLFIALPSFHRKEYLTQALLKNYMMLFSGNILQPEIYDILKADYKEEIELIQQNIQEDRLIILSRDDTFLFYLFGKKNLLDANPQNDLIISKDDMDFALKRVSKPCPRVIAAECNLFNRCQNPETLIAGWPPIEMKLLSELEAKCQYRYSPTRCTTKLCLAEAK